MMKELGELASVDGFIKRFCGAWVCGVRVDQLSRA